VVGPLGYAQPEQPIHVVLARDEEIAIENRGSPQVEVVAPPPAYGLWRSSVVCFCVLREISPKKMTNDISISFLLYEIRTDKHALENKP
jgi:hypothetical protein